MSADAGAPVARRPGAGEAILRRWARATSDWVWRYKENLGLVPVIILLVVIGSLVSPTFVTFNNAIIILQQSAVLGFVVFAASLIILSGKFDLSLEGTVSFAPMLGAWLLTTHAPGSGIGLNPFAAIGVTIGTGALIGLVNAFLIVGIGINSFLATLAMQILLVGLTYMLTSGLTLYSPSRDFLWLGQANVQGIPIAIIAAALLFVVGALFMRYNKYGRRILAVGGNVEAARSAGIRPGLVWTGVFVLGGILAAIAGIILSGRVDAVTVGQGRGITFDMFAAAAIGGIALSGGRGHLLGALLGVLLLGMIGDVMTLAQIQTQVINAVRGAIILVALVINRYVVAERG
jgi:simple sugar transport system permease protein